MAPDMEQAQTATEQGESLPDMSGWMTVHAAADHLQLSYETVRLACQRNRRTDGREGLKCTQRGSRRKYLIKPGDAMRWINGLKPES